MMPPMPELSSEVMLNNPCINWRFWSNLTEVKVWQAVALSCNIDPDYITDKEALIFGHREVKRRIKNLQERLNDRYFFTQVTINKESHLNGIKLSEFSAWWIRFFGAQGIPMELSQLGWKLVSERASIEKMIAGRYTLEEASILIARGRSKRKELILQMLKDAALSNDLLLFYPNCNLTYQYGENWDHEVSAFYEESFWDYLNKWLDSNFPKIKYRFPNPKEIKN